MVQNIITINLDEMSMFTKNMHQHATSVQVI